MKAGEPVLDVERTRTDVYFRCRRCRRSWTRSYEVTRWFDDDGGLVEIFYRNGTPVPPPRSGISCIFCGGLRVDWSEAPLRPEPAAAEAEEGAEPSAPPTPPWRPWRRYYERPDGSFQFPFMRSLRPQRRPQTFRFP